MKKETIVLLILSIFIICVSQISAKGLIINEAASYGEYTCDRSIPFIISQDGSLILDVEYTVKEGRCTVAILNPSDEIVFSEGGASFKSADSIIPVYKGIWHLTIKCEGFDSAYAKDGYYKITGKFKK